jgi:hypothetical protein
MKLSSTSWLYNTLDHRVKEMNLYPTQDQVYCFYACVLSRATKGKDSALRDRLLLGLRPKGWVVYKI